MHVARKRRGWLLLAVSLLVLGLMAPAAIAHPDPDDGSHDEEMHGPASDLSAPLVSLDAAMGDVVSSGPTAKVVKNLDLVGRGDRLVANATTDVWAHDGYAYTGTFNSPCGGDPEAGIWVWDVSNKNKPSFVTVIPSPTGSRTNDVRVASMNSGDILVHSNEPCAGGPGGFEVYNVEDPENPVFLASVQTDDVNLLLQNDFGFTDFGVHNLWLFTQGDRDYVAATVESLFGNFQIFDITDPSDIQRVGFWGAEQSPNAIATFPALAGVDWENTVDFVNVILAGNAYNNDGFGASTNRFLHDVTITADGTQAYLANWDEGLVLLDISDPTNPTWVSTAIDVANGSRDGEVNSHSVWPSEDGTIVVEGEEDFAPCESIFTIDTGPTAGPYPSAEGAITVPIFTLPGQTMSGPTTYVGLACDADSVPAGSGIALIQRGICTFSSKIDNAEAKGYSGVVVFNDEARGDSLVSMGGVPVNLPGVFVGHSTGLAIAGVADDSDLVIGAAGETVSASAVPNAWSGLRIWDYSDPTAPVLASLFDTVCSANPVDPSCDPAGTYSVHNVQVETLGNKVLAYVSWYSDGMLVLDVTDPYNPVEVARYFDNSSGFIAGNGGNPHDFWGVYKETNSPFFYGSDRNGGLRVFKLKGSGSDGKGASKKP